MQTVTMGSKYQVVIPKEIRNKNPKLKPGAKIIVSINKDKTVEIKAQEKNWADESYGFMKKAWKGIDPIAEIEKMRNEWDQKP